MIRSFASVLAATGFAAFAQAPCEQLNSLNLADTTITLAESMAAGPFQNPGATPAAAAQMLPAHCRVAATLRPSLDSDIKVEVWLPVAAAWNGKFGAVGGGGWVGVISYAVMAAALEEGYATASTDTGHQGGNANFAVGHPEKVVDFAYAALRVTSLPVLAPLRSSKTRTSRVASASPEVSLKRAAVIRYLPVNFGTG